MKPWAPFPLALNLVCRYAQTQSLSAERGSYDALFEFDQLCVLVSPPKMSDLLSAPRRAWLNRLKQNRIVAVYSRSDVAVARSLARIPQSHLFAIALNLRIYGAISGATPTRTGTGGRCGLLSDHCGGTGRGASGFVVRCGVQSATATAPGTWGAISLSLRHDQVHSVQMLRRGMQ